MPYGLKEKHIDLINSVFEQYSAIETVILYGSRAKGDYRNGSDIDLSLRGKNISNSLLFKIDTALDDLLLPYTIDLSILDKIQSSDLLEHINRIGIVFYEKKNEGSF